MRGSGEQATDGLALVYKDALRLFRTSKLRVGLLATVVVILIAGVFAVIRQHAATSRPGSCPAVGTINALINAHVASASYDHNDSLITCDYSLGSNRQALNIGVESVVDSPCHGTLVVGRFLGCYQPGAPGTAPNAISIFVNTADRYDNHFLWQFTSYTRSITESMLVMLANKVVTSTPSPNLLSH